MSDFQKAKWIACDERYAAPFVIKRFTAKQAQTAKIRIFGLGYYELFLNGERVGTDFFKPAVSDYAKRDYSKFGYPTADQTTQRVYYNEYLLRVSQGENIVVVLLGGGFFRQTKRRVEGPTSFSSELLLSYEIELEEGAVFTDGSEFCADSFITESNIFFGETHDYAGWSKKPFFGERLKNDGELSERFSNASRVRVVQPTAQITKQLCPCDRIVRKLTPKALFKKGVKTIYDAGENISGFVLLRPLSKIVVVRHAEVLSGESLDYSSTGENQVQTVEYKNAEGRIVHPWFHWSGFRYFEVEGEADCVKVAVVHTPAENKLTFDCGNETLNWLFNAYLRTQKSGLHGGITMDCPHRERLGYTGDGQLVAESAMLLLDCKSVFEKWMQDIADCQDVKSGHVQHTAPFMGGGGGPGGWGSAIVLVPYAHYKLFGEKQILRKYFANMQAFIKCMHGFCEGGLVVRERERGWCLGDWCTPQTVEIPEPLVNTFYYVRCMQLVEKIAEIIGEKCDYGEYIKSGKDAINRAYYDGSSGDYCANKQGANVFALLLGLGDARTKAHVLEKYNKEKHFDTGIFGTDLLCEWLVSEGEIQTLFDLLTARGFPSFGYMKDSGATTLWEGWNNDGSLSHPMLGGCAKQLVYGILGIRADVGFKHVEFCPQYISGICFAKAELRLNSKIIKLRYDYRNGEVKKYISINGEIVCSDD